MKTQDIDTTAVTDAPVITDLAQLTDTVSKLATHQLVLDSAAARLQTQTEAAKLAYEQATAPITAEVTTLFAAVERYCEKHKDTLFPVKGNGKRSKTFQVLQHKLQYRESSTVTAPEDIVERIHRRAAEIDNQISLGLDIERNGNHIAKLQAIYSLLLRLLRQPPQELNKDAAKAALAQPDEVAVLNDIGITLNTTETFKLAFHFTPDA